MSLLVLTGCQPTPMASYLKAIGVIRLLSEQGKGGDPKGLWGDEGFILHVDLDEEAILNFFCHDYIPTPVISPWNKGGGFYTGPASKVIEAMVHNTDPRFDPFRKAIEAVRAWTDVSFDRESKTDNKEFILASSRASLPENALPWLDAIGALRGDDSISYNPALGTGGNEGNFEMSINFMQRVMELFGAKEPATTRELARSSLFRTSVPGLTEASIGQLSPGRAGGYNQGMGIEKKDFKINPWDYVLMIEGAVVLAGSAVRRYPTADRSYFTSPFTVRYSSAGVPSGVSDETSRYETWLPIWRNPASWPEIRHLFGEGRSTVGRRVSANGLDFSRAAGTLGVDRGIESFERHVFLKRRGDSFIALPAGRISVGYKPQLEILNELDPILNRIRRFLSEFKKNVPPSFGAAFRRIENTIYDCSRDPTPETFSKVARAFGNFESRIAQRDRSLEPNLKRPLFGISPRWLGECDDGGIEIRLAAALASIKYTSGVGDMRSVMSGTDPKYPWTWSETGRKSTWHGQTLADRLAGVLVRRIQEAERLSSPRFPAESFLSVSPHDIMPFIRGEYDADKMEELLWFFTLINWRAGGLAEIRGRWSSPVLRVPLSRTWCLLKLLHTPHQVRKASLRREPRIISLLSADRVREACDIAKRRLAVNGVRPYPVVYEEKLDTKNLIAGLLIPAGNQALIESHVLMPSGNET